MRVGLETGREHVQAVAVRRYRSAAVLKAFRIRRPRVLGNGAYALCAALKLASSLLEPAGNIFPPSAPWRRTHGAARHETTSSNPIGSHSPRTARSRRSRACSPAPRTSTTSSRTAPRCLMPPGLFCVNAGHRREPIVKAIQEMAAKLDYLAFPVRPPKVFELVSRLALSPRQPRLCLFSRTSRVREAVGYGLKACAGHHKARGEAPAPASSAVSAATMASASAAFGGWHGRQPQAVRQTC